MMEDFRNIADETFPSFLGHSLNSSASVVFDNITISPNPGLPVAASTDARSQTACNNRLSDICASYLEGEHSSPSRYSHSSQADPEKVGRFALSFQEDTEVATQGKEPQLPSLSWKESHSIFREQDQNVIEHSNHNQDTFLEVLPLEPLEDRIYFLPDNENNKVDPSEPSEKLRDGEASSDHLSTSLSSFLENEKLSSLASSECGSTDDDIDDEEFFDNRLEAYFEQLMQPEKAGGDMDTQKLSEHSSALKFFENAFFQKENFEFPDGYQAVTGADSGDASDEDSQNQGLTRYPVQREMLPRAVQQQNSVTTGEVQDNPSAAELRLDSLYLQCMESCKADVSDVLPKQEMQPGCQAAASEPEVLPPGRGFLGHYTTPEVIPANVPQTGAAACEVGLPDAYLSPTADSCDNISLSTADKGDLPHNIVYQNEEGKWVTDLAYYTSFEEEQGFNLSEDEKINEFVTGSEAAAMIARDQEEFEKEHRLVQVEKADVLNASELADTSWKSAYSCTLLKTPEVDKDASYLRLSLGEFFGQRSEALGCLGGGSDVKRPSFGYYITSPEKREPVALLTQSESSGGDTRQEISQLSEVFSEDAEAQTKGHVNSLSCEGTQHRMNPAAEICESINPEPATKSKAKGGLHQGKSEDSSSNHSDSVLSISTIASVIANASCSADPSQLAAMMMDLCKNSKKTGFPPGIVKETELSARQVLPSSVENSAFDMERYLKKTDEVGHESEYESIVKHEASVQNTVPDPSSLGKDKNKDSLAEDLKNEHRKQQEREKQILGYLNQGNGALNVPNLSGAPSHEDRAVSRGQYLDKLLDVGNSKHFQSEHADPRSNQLNTNTSSSGNKVQTCGIPSAAEMEAAQKILLACQSNSLSRKDCCDRKDTETAGQAANDVPEPCSDLVEPKTGNVLSLSTLKPATQSSKYVSVSPTKAKPTQKLSNGEKKQNAQVEKRRKAATAACGENVKHVTFEKLSPTPQNGTEQKPECDLQPLEDEQYSFRPSTSPLIHSSPSETSGTAFSGPETDFTYTSCCQESSCKENVLPQLVYSNPSMSRLTYVSAADSALKSTAAVHNLETSWGENSSELSTTIIQASPTPSQEHTSENLQDLSCLRNKKEEPLNTGQKSEENELAGLQRKQDDGLHQGLPKEGFQKNENQVASVPSSVAATLKEQDHVTPGLPSKFSVLQPLPGNVEAPEAWQDPTSKAQRQGLPALNVLPVYPGLSTLMPFNQNSSGDQYIPIPSFKSQVSTSGSQSLPSSVPTLLTGRSLATTPFAQQHLGNIPATGNTVLPQFHGCSSAGFALPAGLPCPGISAGHPENPQLMVGIPLGPNIAPGSLNAASLCNPHSGSWNKEIFSMKSCPGQPLGAGRNEWELPKSPGIGHVKVPEELKLPNACCVGIASQTALSIFNPTERWLQVSIGILSVSINGEKMDPMKYQCLVFKNKAIVAPYSTHDVKILFLPCHSGIFQCILNVASWPVSADAETAVQAEALASRVVLTAVAENPNLEVETGKREILDFGDLTSGSWKALPLKLINKTHAFVPVRLIINANAVAWRCFTFSREPVTHSEDQPLQKDGVSQAAAPSVVNHVIHASYDGQDPEALTVWVLFHAPKKQITSDPLGPADVFVARVDVEVDSPGPSSVIKSIPLRARSGTARIHAPKNLQTLCLSTSVGSTTKQELPLKNAGNIGVNLKIMTLDQDSGFAVEPEDLFLLAGEEQKVTVQFSPKKVTTTESFLKILVLPSGPQYEVVIKGEVVSEKRPVLTTPGGYSNIPPILSNKQCVAWGGVSLGASVQKTLTLRNDSSSVTQHLRLLIRGQDQDCFRLQNIFGSEERLTSVWELKIRPKEDTNIHLMFTPSQITCFFAKLEIKHLGIRSQPGIKFTIPLSGYGGTSKITLENVTKLSDGYAVTLDELLPSGVRKASFCLRNRGSRAAYVKALCLASLQPKIVMDSRVMMVSPEKFVLREGTHEVVTVTWNPREKEENLYNINALVSTVCFFCGDEVSRQQYRRSKLYKPEAENQIVPEKSVVRNVVFDEEFQGEQLVKEVLALPRGTNDIHLFYSNMHRINLSVLDCSTGDEDGVQQSPGLCLESDRSENSNRHISATLDVLPVKGPQGPPLSIKKDELVQNKSDDQQDWAVKPEFLTLTSPSMSRKADTGHVHISNNSSKMLAFELSWPAHCLTVTPHQGVVEPESSTVILVSPNPSLATKPELIPWSGLIYILCDYGQKLVKVQIQEAQAGAGDDFYYQRRWALGPRSESPAVHMAKPLPVFPLTMMEIKNRSIAFPTTRPGQSSESYLEMKNNGDDSMRWHLSSFAPPYVKGVDETGSVYRVSYSAFRCFHVSGTLEAHGEEKVAVIFLPRSKGHYSQFWDVECYTVEKPTWKQNIRFQLSGVGSAENEIAVVKPSVSALPRSEQAAARKPQSEACATRALHNELFRGIYAPVEVYNFSPTRVGESQTLKVNLRNNTFETHLLKFVSPREPFYIRHSRYSLRSHHYINVPVQFKPNAEGVFGGLLVVLTSTCGAVTVRLCGKALA